MRWKLFALAVYRYGEAIYSNCSSACNVCSSICIVFNVFDVKCDLCTNFNRRPTETLNDFHRIRRRRKQTNKTENRNFIQFVYCASKYRTIAVISTKIRRKKSRKNSKSPPAVQIHDFLFVCSTPPNQHAKANKLKALEIESSGKPHSNERTKRRTNGQASEVDWLPTGIAANRTGKMRNANNNNNNINFIIEWSLATFPTRDGVTYACTVYTVSFFLFLFFSTPTCAPDNMQITPQKIRSFLASWR